MNIFVLDTCPARAAVALCDQHVVKMALETAQLLCGVFPDDVAPYRRTHHGHPCAVWARTSLTNYCWLLCHGFALADEYSARFGKVHRSRAVIQWCADHLIDVAGVVPDIGLTPFAQAMPDEYRRPDPVDAYRRYYRGSKLAFARWRHGPAPEWLGVPA